MMVSEKDEPYIEMSDVLTSHMREITYMIVNNSVTPKAVFRVPRTMSLLQWVAPYGRIKHDSIIGSIQHSSSRWVVMLEGNLEACPGKEVFEEHNWCSYSDRIRLSICLKIESAIFVEDIIYVYI